MRIIVFMSVIKRLPLEVTVSLFYISHFNIWNHQFTDGVMVNWQGFYLLAVHGVMSLLNN